MKINSLIKGAMLMPLLALMACADETPYYKTGEGTLQISTSVNTQVTKVNSRDITSEDLVSLFNSLNIVVSRANADGTSGDAVRYWNAENGFPEGSSDLDNGVQFSVKLNSGSYVVEGWAGDSVPASFTKKFFKGETLAQLQAGEVSSVSLVCKIANVAASVVYDADLPEVLSDFTMTVGHAVESLEFTGTPEEQQALTAYYMMPKVDKNLTWTLKGQTKDGTEFTKSGTIENAKSGYQYVLNVQYNTSSSEMGGGAINVTVNEEEIVKEHEIVFRTRPVISGYVFDEEAQKASYFDIGASNPYARATGAIGEVSVIVRSSGRITDVVLGCDKFFSQWLGGDGNVNIYGGASDYDYNKLMENGIVGYSATSVETNDANQTSNYKIRFTDQFTNQLSEGTYVFTIKASDEDYNAPGVNVKSNETQLVIVVSDDGAVLVAPSDPSEADLYYDEVTLFGQVVKEGVEEAGFLYRVKGSGTEWAEATYVKGVPDSRSRALATSTSYSARVTGLRGGTEYEYVAGFIYEDEPGVVKPGSSPLTVRTPDSPQLVNAGFENWVQKGNIIYPSYSADDLYWDSGNTGSTTIGSSYNLTKSNSVFKHSGSYSAELKSTKVVIKFAAGNIFIGKYLATDGTDGILGWGRPFTGKPKQLKGYYKYSNGTIDRNDGSDVPGDIADEFAKGKMDKGIIYIALLDDSKAQNPDVKTYPDYPVLVRTKSSNRNLFNKNGSDVIAYGELVLTEATQGSELVEFTIDLDYRRTDIRPSYIMLTASASQGGDYYLGSSSSVLYLDDFELIY